MTALAERLAEIRTEIVAGGIIGRSAGMRAFRILSRLGDEPAPAAVHAICKRISDEPKCDQCPASVQPYPNVKPEVHGMPGCYHHAREVYRAALAAALEAAMEET